MDKDRRDGVRETTRFSSQRHGRPMRKQRLSGDTVSKQACKPARKPIACGVQTHANAEMPLCKRTLRIK